MTITITQPDDWHLHLRDGPHLSSVLDHSAATFARAVVMPNLNPPIARVQQALDYRKRIVAALATAHQHFEPLMTLYLTPDTTTAEIEAAARCPSVVGAKLYPAGATTNSAAGVRDLTALHPVLASMEKGGLPLLVHGESTDPEVDVFDREAVFVSETLEPLAQRFAGLRIVLEHVTTEQAVNFVRTSRAGIAATITAHHLLYNRNAIFAGGVRPDYYCLPVLKRERHRQALLQAATSGDPKFFLGTDSAPHPRSAKHAACGCAGVYSAHAALPLYAEAFEQAGALHRLEAFASFHGADFYGLPRNRTTISLERHPWIVPASYAFGSDELTPLRAGETIPFRVQRSTTSSPRRAEAPPEP